MDFSSAYANYDTGLQQGLKKKKKKKDLNMNGNRNAFFVVCKAGSLNKAGKGLQGCFWGEGFHSWN